MSVRTDVNPKHLLRLGILGFAWGERGGFYMTVWLAGQLSVKEPWYFSISRRKMRG